MLPFRNFRPAESSYNGGSLSLFNVASAMTSSSICVYVYSECHRSDFITPTRQDITLIRPINGGCSNIAVTSVIVYMSLSHTGLYRQTEGFKFHTRKPIQYVVINTHNFNARFMPSYTTFTKIVSPFPFIYDHIITVGYLFSHS